jgi:hypothetical protein
MVMEAFEQSNGFSALTADELFFVNGGSSYTWSSGGTGNNSGNNNINGDGNNSGNTTINVTVNGGCCCKCN